MAIRTSIWGRAATRSTTTRRTTGKSFIDNNSLNVTTVGVGDGINTTRLQDVDLDGQGAPISVTDFDDLIETLLDVVVGGDVSGNVLTNDGFGADGPGRIASIEINGVTYSFDGSDITYNDGSPQTISGSLLSNVPTQIGGTLTFDFATGAWSFTAPTEVASDITGTFNYVIVDRDGDADTASLSIEVQAGNDAPANSVPASISVNEDTPTKLTGISFADPDIAGGDLTVTLSVTAGTLAATTAGGVSVVSGSGTQTLVLQGTIAALNAFIANAAQGVTYAPVPGSTTDATLTVTSNDNGNTGIGGAQTDTDTVTLDLVAQNDAPTATITPATYNATEQTNLNLHGTGLSIADVDAGGNDITVTLTVTQGILTVTAGNSGVNSVSGSPGSTITITGTITEINNLLGGIDTGMGSAGTIVYNANLDNPGPSRYLDPSGQRQRQHRRRRATDC